MGESAQQFRQNSARVLLVLGENVEARRLITVFTENGFNVFRVASLHEALRSVTEWKPAVIVTNLLLQGGSAFELLEHVRKNAAGTPTIVISSHNHDGNMEEAFRRGASDYIHRPFMHEELINRVVLQCRKPIELDADSWGETGEMGINTLLSSAIEGEHIDQITHDITKMLAKSTHSVRCSLIRAITTNEGMVFAANDDANIAGLRIDLSGYPEIQLVANTKKMIAINDLGQSRALKHIQKKVKSIQFGAMIVAPVFYKGRFFGALSVRLQNSSGEVPKATIRMTSITAKVLSLALSSRSADELGRFGLISAS